MRKKNISSDGDTKIFQKIHITDYNLLFTNSQKNLVYIFTKNVRVQNFGVFDLKNAKNIHCLCQTNMMQNKH